MWYGCYWHKYCSTACGIEVPDSDQLVITGGHAGGQNGRPRVQAYTVGGAKEQLPNLNQPRYQHACGYYYNGNNLVKLLINTLYYSAGNFLRCIWWLGVPTRVISTVQSCWPRVPLPGSTVGCCHRLQQDWGLPHWTTDWLSLVDKSPMMIQWCSLVILGGSGGSGVQILEWEQAPGQWKRLQMDLKQSRSYHGMSVIKIEDVIDSINCT